MRLKLDMAVTVNDVEYGPGEVDVPEPAASQIVRALGCPVIDDSDEPEAGAVVPVIPVDPILPAADALEHEGAVPVKRKTGK